MRVRLGHREALPRLVALLRFDPDAIVTTLAGDEIEVSYVGSLSESAQRDKLEARLRAWMSEWELADDDGPDPLPGPVNVHT
jgi:hypothetical protein